MAMTTLGQASLLSRRVTIAHASSLATRPTSRSIPRYGLNTMAFSSSAAPKTQSSGPFSFNVAASYIAKGRQYDPFTHVFHFNPYNRQQTTKGKRKTRPESGQDAFFVSRIGDSGGVALGIADGVGGWMDSGVDPADFSHGICDYMATAAYEQDRAGREGGGGGGGGVAARALGDGGPLTARQLMQRGYDDICRDGTIKAGGSTAVVGLLDPDGTLEAANLGDSGFLHLRLNAVHASSQPQTHGFNTPYQLSVIPHAVMRRLAAFGGARQLCDMPRDSDVTHHRLRHGDVLVFASDGLWDNLFNQDVLRIVSRAMTRTGAWTATDAGISVSDDLTPLTRLDRADAPESGSESGSESASESEPEPGCGAPGGDAQGKKVTLQSLLATELTGAAKLASINPKLDGPFAKDVKKYYPREPWHGGKVDDICVVVVVVSEAQPKLKSRL